MSTRPPSPLNLENDETRNPEAYGPRQTEQRFSQRLRSLMQSADKRLNATQARYKRDFDKRVRKFKTDITTGDLVFVQRETATESEERRKTCRSEAIGYQKLRPKAVGPFPVVGVTTHTVTIIRDGIAHKISKDRVIRAAAPQRQTSGTTESNTPANPADCTTPEASSKATPRLTGSSQDAVLYPAKRAVDLQRMPTSIEIPRLSLRATTEVNPNVVLDDTDENNTGSTVNKSQDQTTVSEDGPQINADGTDTIPSARQAEPSDSNENATEADASAHTSTQAVATDNTETPPRTRSDPESTSKPRRFSRIRKTKNPHYAYDRILAHEFSRSDPEYKVSWTNRPSNEDSWEP